MLICISQVLDAHDLAEISSGLAKIEFQDGKASAGWHAALVKHNHQAIPDQNLAQTLGTRIAGKLQQHPLFRMAARPKCLSPILLSRYSVGMHYGTHTDDALMQGIRSDVSFTVFLSDPQEYEGGELVMDSSGGEQSYKLAAGDAIVYPSTTLHRVDPVRAGMRQVAVGWVQSTVRSAEQRELLFDLESARFAWFRREGKTTEFDLLSKSFSNLLRMWADV